ncbi:hypothetical protein B7463_g12160, partial [Scytalidium lignicola]
MSSSTLSLPASLSPALNVREAIADALYRCVLSFDTGDVSLFHSSMTKDATFDLNGRIMEGIEAIQAQCYDPVSKLDTTHFITNLRINVANGGTTATITANALAQHYRTGTGKEPNATRLLTGSLYWLDVVKDEKEDLWKIKKWILKPTWFEGDFGVMTGN